VKISRLDEETVALSRVDLLCCELLHQIPVSAEIDDRAVHERLFSAPTSTSEPEFEDDWQRYVRPGLRHLFQSSLQVVRGDLKGFPPAQPDENYTLRLPLQHLDAWIHSLNQARLALATRHNFTEREMESALPVAGDARSLALFQVHFYGFLMECFLRELEGE
jgi:hypothetical protein